ncbi:MAG: hypothetical protein ACI364_05880, partial [Coriobacteriales bacterium]
MKDTIEREGWEHIEVSDGYEYDHGGDMFAYVSQDADETSWQYTIYNRMLDVIYVSGGGFYDFEEYEAAEDAMDA